MRSNSLKNANRFDTDAFRNRSLVTGQLRVDPQGHVLSAHPGARRIPSATTVAPAERATGRLSWRYDMRLRQCPEHIS